MSASKEYVEDYNTATMPSKKHSSSIHPSTFYAELSQELPASIHFALGFVGSRHIRHVNGSCVKKKSTHEKYGIRTSKHHQGSFG